MSQLAETIKPVSRQQRSPIGLWYAIVVTGLGAFTLLVTIRFERPTFVDKNDPGPAAVPAAAAVFLLLGGLVLLIRWFAAARSQRRAARIGEPVTDGGAERDPSNRKNVALVTVGLCVYVAAMSVAGFLLATFLFSTLMMMRLGTRWWIAAATTGITVILIQLVFVVGFQVSLPEGWLDASWWAPKGGKS